MARQKDRYLIQRYRTNLKVQDGGYIYFGDDNDANLYADGTGVKLTGVLALVGDVSLDGDLTLSTEDISVVQGQQVLFAGQAGGEYIWSATAGELDLVSSTKGMKMTSSLVSGTQVGLYNTSQTLTGALVGLNIYHTGIVPGAYDMKGLQIDMPASTGLYTQCIRITTLQTKGEVIWINTDQTLGEIINMAFTATTLAGAMTGINLDMSTNVTHGSQTMKGLVVAAPSGSTSTGVEFGANVATAINHAGTTMKFAIAGTDEVTISATALYPASDDGQTLGILASNEWSDLFLASGGVIGWNNNDVTITHASNLLTLEGGNLRLTGDLSTTGRLEFYSANAYITSDYDGEILFSATGQIRFGATNGIVMNSYLKLFSTDTDGGNTQGLVWLDDSEQTIKYRRYSDPTHWYTRTIVNLEEAQTFTNSLTISSNNRIYFRDAGLSIYAIADGELCIKSDGSGSDAIILDANVKLGGYLWLYATDVDGGDTAGLVWWDDSEGTIKYRRPWDPTHWYTKTIVNLEDAQTFENSLTMDTTNKLYFRDSGISIASDYDGCLYFDADGDNQWAFIFRGNVYVSGYLRLLSTASVATVAGQMWIDTGDWKIHFFDGTAERIIADDR